MTPRNKFLIIGNLVIFVFVGVLGFLVGGKKMRNRGTTSVAAPLEATIADACKADNDGKVIAVKGYLSLGSKTRCRMNFGMQGCYLDFDDKSYTGRNIEAYVRVGSEPGTMERIPADYSSSDLRVHTRNGDARYDDYVRVVGEVSTPGEGLLGVPVCSITVDAVDRAQLPTPAANPEEIKPTPTPQRKRK